MKRIFIVLFLFCFALYGAEKITLVKERKPQAEIVVGEKPTRAVQFAAFELQHIVQMMTGAKLPIVKKQTSGKLPIILGGAKPGEFKREQYSVSVTPQGIYLKGNDFPDYGKVDYSKAKTYPKAQADYHSTLYAVYDFLEYCAGVRFYGPDDLWIGMDKRPDLTVQPFERRYEPKEQALRYTHRHLKNEPLYQLRMRCNVLYANRVHNAYSLGFRYWAKSPHPGFASAFVERRPEYFSRGYDKPRYETHMSPKFLAPQDAMPAQICRSHPDVVKHFANEAVCMYSGKRQPGTIWWGIYKAMPDCPITYGFGYADNMDWCLCEKCKKQFPGLSELDSFNYQHWRFANNLSREIKKLNPKIILNVSAYNDYLRYPDPKIVKLDPDISVNLTLKRDLWFARCHKDVQWQIKGYQDWAKKEAKKRIMTTWEHMLQPQAAAKQFFHYHYFPFFYPKETAKFYKQQVKYGFQGAFLEVDPYLNTLEGYLAMRTVWDPDYDTDKVIKEYYHLMYREAAEPMKAFFELNESIVMDPKNYPDRNQHIHTQRMNWSIGTHERMKKLNALFEKARKVVKDPDAKKRIEHIYNYVWKQALQGRMEFDKRLATENIPLQNLSVSYLGKNAIPTAADWANATPTVPWLDQNTMKPYSGKETPLVKMCCNDKDLFIYYEENTSLPYQLRDEILWRNSAEFFFGKRGDFPCYQLAVGVKGELINFYYYNLDASLQTQKNQVAMKLLKNELTPNSWKFVLTFPMKDIGLVPGERIRANFTRARKVPAGKDSVINKSTAWNFITPGTPTTDALYRMGWVHVPPASTERKAVINSGFKAIGKNGMPAGWMQNSPALKDGAKIKFNGREVSMDASAGKVSLSCQTLIPARHGDKVTIRFTAQGTGKIALTVKGYRPVNRWNATWCTSWNLGRVAITEKPVQKTVVKVLDGNLKARDINAIRVEWTAEKGSNVRISDISVSLNEK